MPARLSARQEQCVRLTAFRTDKEIAAHLGISEATVKKHVHEACQRLGVNRRKAALAILDQNGPGYPNDPMAEAVQAVSDPAVEGDRHDGPGLGTAAALERGRSANGAGPAESDRTRPSGAPASDARDDGGSRHGLSGPVAGRPAGHGDAGRPEAVLGYRSPPRGPLFRLTLIAVIAVVICALLIAVGGMVGDIHHILARLDPKS